jgi:2-oxoisovalerate dehydrogenase E2 component (dihydrolipoyl transacylase)
MSGYQYSCLFTPCGGRTDDQLEGAELIAFTETWKKYIEEPWRWLKIDG